MEKIVFVLAILIGVCYYSIYANAFSPSGWTKGHATFYGGSDASGTIGMFNSNSISYSFSKVFQHTTFKAES
jgi:hypothetical protein